MPDPRETLVRKMIAEGTSDDDIRATLKAYDAQSSAAPSAMTPPTPPQGDLGRYAGYKKIGDFVTGALKSAYHHPIETGGALGATAAVAATAPVSLPAALLAAGLGGIGGAGLGLIKNAAAPAGGVPEASPTTALGVAKEMGKQGAINAAFEGGGRAGLAGMKAAKNLYLRSLKPTKAVLESAPAFRTGGQEAARQELATTALKERAPVGGAGVEKVRGRIDDLNQQIADRLNEADMNGMLVDPQDVVTRASDAKWRFANQVAPQADLAAIDKVIADFMTHPSFKGDAAAAIMTLPEAQAMKQGTYRVLGGKAYGEVGSASSEAQKAIARGLKEEIAAKAPAVGPLNAQESRLITLEKALQDRARTAGHADPFKLGEQVLAAGAQPKAALLGLINRPGILSRGAIGLNDLSRAYNAIPGKAAAMRAALMTMLGTDEP